MLKDLIEFEGLQNICDVLSDDELNKIGAAAVEGFDNDMRSRAGWDGEMKEAMNLALQVREKKNFPWENSSNVKLPLLTEAAINFNSMMYPALIPPTDIVKTRIVGEDATGEKEAQSIRVSKHMSFQILEEMDEWEEEMDIGLMIQPILGNMYKKTYFDGVKGRNVSEMLSPAEFVVAYDTKNLDSCYRKSHLLEFTKNDVKKRVLSGDFLDVNLGDPVIKDKEQEGEAPVVADNSTTYKFIEQHTYLDLDGDELEEPYIITTELNSKKTVRITAGYSSENILTNQNGDVYDVPQDQYFTKYGFVPNPDGSFLDLGLGKLLGPTNHTVNTLINQLIDAGTRSITGGGFLGRGIKIKGGNLKFKMGEYKRIDSTGDDLRKNIVHLPNTEPSGVLFNLLNLLINSGQRLASTLDSQVGDNPGQNQKATTSAIVQENGQKIFNGIYKRNHRSLKAELKKLFKLNSVYLPAESYLNVLDANLPEEVGRTIARTDYDPKSLNIVPAADSAYTSSQQRMAKSRALMEKLGTGLVNPQVVMQRALVAEEQTGIEQIMEVPPQQPPFEQTKFQAEMQYKYSTLKLDIMNKEREWINNEMLITSQAMLNLSKAEGEQAGIQYNEYSAQMNDLREMAKENIEVMKMEEARRSQQQQQTQQQQAQPNV